MLARIIVDMVLYGLSPIDAVVNLILSDLFKGE